MTTTINTLATELGATADEIAEWVGQIASVDGDDNTYAGPPIDIRNGSGRVVGRDRALTDGAVAFVREGYATGQLQ